MRLAASLLILICCPVLIHGQDAARPQSKDGEAVQELLEKLGDLQPPDLTYADLAAQSDVIVVAKALSKTDVEWSDKIGGDFGKGSTNLVSNRLKILSVLKGQAADEIDVMTLEWKSGVIVLTNSDFARLRPKQVLPVLVTVEIDGEITDYGIGMGDSRTYTIEPEYLLYLRQVDDGKFVAVTGQRNSGGSVRRLN